jgi:hypothetical protein
LESLKKPVFGLAFFISASSLVVKGAMNNILEGQRDTINTQTGLRSDRSPKNMVLDSVIGGVGEVNQSYENTYNESVFIKNNLKLIVYID